MIRFVNFITKLTAWPVQKILFRTRIYYEDKTVQSRKIKGRAIIVSNHTSVYDYAVFLFVFPFRTLRYQMAEVLFKKKVLGVYLKMLGGIYVDRASFDYSFMKKSEDILKKGGVVGIFPESRLPKKDEIPPIEFKPAAAFLALKTNTPVIPVFTSGGYFKKPCRVVIGKPMDLSLFVDSKKSEKENLADISAIMREKVISLGEMYEF